jgi:hypothetical protein
MNYLILTLSALFISISANPVNGRLMAGCLSTCNRQDIIVLTEDNAREVAGSCFSSADFSLSKRSQVDTLAMHFYVDTYSNSCTSEIYDYIDSLVYYNDIETTSCQSFCSGSPVPSSNVSFDDASKCFASISPPFAPMNTEELYDMYFNAYELAGQFTLKKPMLVNKPFEDS